MTDRLDALDLMSLSEDPGRWERIIEDQQGEAEKNPDVAHLLHTIHLERDRAASFRRFHASREFAAILRVLSIFRVTPPFGPIAEVGGGSGYLCWALVRCGFRDI